MSNPVCVIRYFDERDGWQFCGFTDCANTAAKMLLENHMISGSTKVYYRQENGTVILRELDTFPIKDRVEVVARALSGKNDQIRGISNWDLEVCDVYDQDDYGAEDEYYGECICSSSL